MQLDIERYRGFILATILVLLGIVTQQLTTESSQELAASASTAFSQVAADTVEAQGFGNESAESIASQSAPAAVDTQIQADHYSGKALFGYFVLGALLCGVCLRLARY